MLAPKVRFVDSVEIRPNNNIGHIFCKAFKFVKRTKRCWNSWIIYPKVSNRNPSPMGLTQMSRLIWTKFFSCGKFQGSIIFDERAVWFHTWEIPDRTGLSFEQMSIFQELTRIWRKVMKLNKMFFLEFFGNLSREKFLNHRPVSEQIILSSLDFRALVRDWDLYTLFLYYNRAKSWLEKTSETIIYQKQVGPTLSDIFQIHR